MNQNINIQLTDREGNNHKLTAPTDMQLNLMELCKVYEFPIEGTCGGMALCASCQCYIVSNHKLPKKTPDEEAMLSEAFHVKSNSRLSCQIQIEKQLEGLRIELAPD